MKEIFWKSIADYNFSTWPVQTVLVVCAAVMTFILFFRPSRRAASAMKIFLVILSLWIAVCYYSIFGATREHSNVMALFWCMMAVSWLYDLFTDYSSFGCRKGRRRILGIVIMCLPLVYPLISVLRGLEWPRIATPVIPSSIAMFMLGLIVAFPGKKNIFAFLFIIHWAITAVSKVIFFAIPEDFLLTAACIPAAFVLLYDKKKSSDDVKPSWKIVNGLVIAVIAVIVIAMLVSI